VEGAEILDSDIKNNLDDVIAKIEIYLDRVRGVTYT